MGVILKKSWSFLQDFLYKTNYLESLLFYFFCFEVSLKWKLLQWDWLVMITLVKIDLYSLDSWQCNKSWSLLTAMYSDRFSIIGPQNFILFNYNWSLLSWFHVQRKIMTRKEKEKFWKIFIVFFSWLSFGIEVLIFEIFILKINSCNKY